MDDTQRTGWQKRILLFLTSQCTTLFGSTLVQMALTFYTEQQSNQVLLFIKDNGIGIAEADLPRVFEKGFTGQNGRNIQNSTGIGLYLCKRLCDKLGIGLSLHSGNNGTTAILSFHINHFLVQG